MDTLAFELVAPERLLVSRQVEMVTVPGEEGDFGVLPGHAPLVSTLRTGVIDVRTDGATLERFFVAGGFAEVSPERCTVLAEVAVPVAELDRTKLEAELKTYQDQLLVADDAAKAQLATKMDLVQAKLAVLVH
jgi:F-type H+-transporting ATPase subunit epsilon